MRTPQELIDLIPKDNTGWIPNARMRELNFFLKSHNMSAWGLAVVEQEILYYREYLQKGLAKREKFFKSIAQKYL